MNRAVLVVNGVLTNRYNQTIIVTHGNLFALLIKYSKLIFGYQD